MSGVDPTTGQAGEPRFCVVIPAYREAGRIGDCVRSVLEYCPDVVVVDDGSDDNTAEEAEGAGAHVLRHGVNRGKGVALRTGFDHAMRQAYDFVIVMDGDGQHAPADIPKLIAARRRDGARVVCGNRMDDPRTMPLVRRLTNRFMSWLLSRRMGQRVPDTQNGFRLYENDVLPALMKHESEGFAAESEVLLDLATEGIVIASAPTRIIYGDERSKIRPVRDTIRFFAMLRRHKAQAVNREHTMGTDSDDVQAVRLPLLAARAGVGGVLMGLANLVPGISGGTMLLAAGIYPAFIEAIADATRLRFRARSITVLAGVVAAAGVAIVLLAGPVKTLVVDHRWVMYSLFIGLTLGGLPIVWGMIGRATPSVRWGALGGFAGMALLALAQQRGAGGGAGASGWIMLFLAGAAGASAMILPGVSGGYLLLVLGQYVPILGSIDRFKDALQGGDLGTAVSVGLGVGLPIGLGVLAGVVGISNLLKVLLHRCREATLGVLMGLLLGAVVGLWPFQAGVAPEPGDVVKGRVVTAENLAELDRENYPTAFFSPRAGQVLWAVVLIGAGIGVTTAVSRLGGGSGEGVATGEAA